MIDLSWFFTSPFTPAWPTFAMVGSPSYFKEQSNSKMSKTPDPLNT